MLDNLLARLVFELWPWWASELWPWWALELWPWWAFWPAVMCAFVGEKIDLSSLKMSGTGSCGSDCRLKRRASKALMESRESLLRGSLPRICLSTAICCLCLRILTILNGRKLSGSIWRVPMRKSKVEGWKDCVKIESLEGPSFKRLSARNRSENFVYSWQRFQWIGRRSCLLTVRSDQWVIRHDLV